MHVARSLQTASLVRRRRALRTVLETAITAREASPSAASSSVAIVRLRQASSGSECAAVVGSLARHCQPEEVGNYRLATRSRTSETTTLTLPAGAGLLSTRHGIVKRVVIAASRAAAVARSGPDESQDESTMPLRSLYIDAFFDGGGGTIVTGPRRVGRRAARSVPPPVHARCANAAAKDQNTRPRRLRTVQAAVLQRDARCRSAAGGTKPPAEPGDGRSFHRARARGR